MAVSHSIAPIFGGFWLEIRTIRTCVLILFAVKLLSNRTVSQGGRQAVALLVGGKGLEPSATDLYCLGHGIERVFPDDKKDLD